MDSLYGGIFGLAIGDALGVPLEFTRRKDISEDMLEDFKGIWSDDTSLVLCTLDSLKNGIDYKDIMDKFVLWLYHDKYCSCEKSFGVGVGTLTAIEAYVSGTEPIHCGSSDEYNNGNGSLMRILPVLFYLRKKYGENFFDYDISMEIIDHICGLTHNHLRSKIACLIYLKIANNIIINQKMDLVNIIDETLKSFFLSYKNNEMDHYYRLKDFLKFVKEDESNIKSSGYVVHTLEAALWALGNSSSYVDAVKKAVLLGDDSDTVGAVCGSLAGLYYGYKQIPEKYIEALRNKDLIVKICDDFLKE